MHVHEEELWHEVSLVKQKSHLIQTDVNTPNFETSQHQSLLVVSYALLAAIAHNTPAERARTIG